MCVPYFDAGYRVRVKIGPRHCVKYLILHTILGLTGHFLCDGTFQSDCEIAADIILFFGDGKSLTIPGLSDFANTSAAGFKTAFKSPKRNLSGNNRFETPPSVKEPDFTTAFSVSGLRQDRIDTNRGVRHFRGCKE